MERFECKNSPLHCNHGYPKSGFQNNTNHMAQKHGP